MNDDKQYLYSEEFLKPREFNYSCNNNTVLSFINNNTPFIIRNNVNESLCTKWQNLDYLSNTLGEIQLPIESYKDSFYDINTSTIIHLTLKEYMDYLLATQSQKNLYLAELELYNRGRETDSVLCPLNSDIVDDDLLYHKTLLYSRVLFLGKNTISQMHYHKRCEAILNQILGVKRVFLFPPNNGLFYQMKPYAWYLKKNNWSKIIYKVKDALDFKEILKTKKLINGFEIVLNPGDSLYIPIYWWHIVFGENISLSYTDFFFADFKKKYLTFLGLRSGNQIAALLKYWKQWIRVK
jgi:hypothetical protein